MPPEVKMFLVWKNFETPYGFSRIKEFENIMGVNRYLETLDPSTVSEIKVISGIILEERSND